MNGAESLIRTASACGIEVCFANFGTSEMNLVLALDSVPGIRPVAALFEGVCAGAADGYGRMLDRPAMSLLHMGVGLVNGLANLHNARRARTPMFTVVGELATWHQSFDSIEFTDIAGLATPVSGWVRACRSANSVATDTSEAIAASLKGQGSVLIVPQDCQWEDCDETAVSSPEFFFESPDDGRVREAARLLASGQPTLLLLGGRSLRDRGLLAASRISQASGCAILAETFIGRMERGPGIPTVQRLPYFPDQAQASLAQYRNVILVGSSDPVSIFGYKNVRSRALSEDQTTLELTLAGQDIELALESLAEMIGAKGKPAPSQAGVPKVMPGKVPSSPAPLNLESAFGAIAALQPEGAIVVEEAVTSAGAYYALSTSAPRHTLLGVTGGAIGQGIPCATGAAIACPDRPVINVQADGSALYTLQGLWTQAREGLNVTTLICSNRSYEILKVELARGGYNNLGKAATELTSLRNPPIDWTRLSQGMGVPGVSVATAKELENEIKKALGEPGPHLIEMLL